MPSESVFRPVGRGTPWLTGGMFGIEGRIWIVVVELVGIVVLLQSQKASTTAATLPADQ